MAQVLKEEAREKIINAAKEEFLRYGFDNANMRRIAAKSNMTVGNLYRYFKNKEDINYQIVREVLSMIDDLLKKSTDNGITFFDEKFNLPDNKNRLLQAIDALSIRLVEIFNAHRDEFNILMMGSQLNNKLILWFTSLIDYMLKENHDEKKNIYLLAKSYAISIISGLKELFRINYVNADELKEMVQIYLRSFIFMLQTDVGKYSGEKNELY